jgi:hypothetical protein
VRYFDPSGLDVTVSFYSGGTGHIGLSVNGSESYGYYPNGSPLVNFGTLFGLPAPGAEVPDSLMQGSPPAQQVTLLTTPAQDAAVLAAIQDATMNSNLFNLYSNNCATVAESILQNAGLQGIPNTIFPIELIEALQLLSNVQLKYQQYAR